MIKFQVLITRDTTESALVIVEADSPAKAQQAALAQALANPGAISWAADDCAGGVPYLADPDELPEPAGEAPAGERPGLVCPDCGEGGSLYQRQDRHYCGDTGKWEEEPQAGDVECTECDWSGYASDLILESDFAGEDYTCNGCGRVEADCSANPCEAVIADRES